MGCIRSDRGTVRSGRSVFHVGIFSAAMLSNEQKLQVISSIGPELESRRDIDPADQQRANQIFNVFRSMVENVYEQHQRGLLAKSSIKAPRCTGWSILARLYWNFAHRCRQILKSNCRELLKTRTNEGLTPEAHRILSEY